MSFIALLVVSFMCLQLDKGTSPERISPQPSGLTSTSAFRHVKTPLADDTPLPPPDLDRTNSKQETTAKIGATVWGSVYDKVRPSIVRVDWDQTAWTNGTIVTPEGHVLVSNTVLKSHYFFKTRLHVTLANGRRLPAIPLGWSTEWGIGLIKIDSKERFPFVMMSDAKTTPLSECMTIGFPYNAYRKEEEPRMCWGTIDAVSHDQWLEGSHSLIGNSGESLFDEGGNLLGIFTHSSDSGTYFTSTRLIRSLWQDLTQGQPNLDSKRLFKSYDLAKLLPTAQTETPSEPKRAAVRIKHRSNPYGWSGVLISPDGLIATCAHHKIRTGESVTIEIADGRNLKGTILGMNPITDVGLVKIDIGQSDASLPFVRIGQSAKSNIGSIARMYGFPGDSSKREPLEEMGRIAPEVGPDSQVETKWLCAADFGKQARGGQSGSGLFNEDNELIGILNGGGENRLTVRIETLLAQWSSLNKATGFSEKTNEQRSAVQRAFDPVSERLRPCVVEILRERTRVSLGFFVDAHGHVITKLSELPDQIRCRTSDGKEYSAEITKRSRENDLALVKIASIDSPFVPLMAKSSLSRFDHVAAILPSGKRPWAQGLSPRQHSPLVGVVTALPKRIAAIPGYLGELNDDPAGLKLAWSPPDSQELQENDIVLSVNGKRTPNLVAFSKVMQPSANDVIGYAGDSINVEVMRGAKLLKKTIRLSETPRESTAEESARRSGFTDAYDTDLSLYMAECGAPVVNSRGEAIGIAIATRGGRYLYVLTSQTLSQFISE